MAFGFGRKSLEQQLSEHGRRTEAEVLRSEPTKHHQASYGNELNGRTWKLGLRVRPPDEPPFDVELSAGLRALFMPRAGDRIDVLYDPDDHSRTVIDPALELAPRYPGHSDVRSWVTLPKGEQAIAEAQSAPPDRRTELDRFARFYAQGALSDDEYTELRRRILGLPEPTTVPVLSFQGRAGEVVVSVEREAEPADAPAADPLDELERLARLRDSGALSNEEFEARKRALLGNA